MAEFKTAYFKTLIHEGGYSDHPSDRGGETYKGIARSRNSAWGGWSIIDGYKSRADFLKALEEDPHLENLVIALYKMNYWDRLSLDDMNDQLIAEELFDTAVNMGIGTASRFLQEALNLLNRNQKNFPDLKVDGMIGPRTMAAANNYTNRKAMLKTLNGLQFCKYRNICEADETQEVFFHGWLNRV